MQLHVRRIDDRVHRQRGEVVLGDFERGFSEIFLHHDREHLPHCGVGGDMKTRFLVCAILALTTSAFARVKLVALPERARVVVSLSHPDATLVEEERVLTLQKGVNHVDFSWAGVNIDPSSIQVRMLGHPDKVLVLNTSYPPNENALVWEVSSPAAQEE